MQRFAVGIEFSGAHYRGWQTQQPGVASVQETIEKVLSKVANETIILHGAHCGGFRGDVLHPCSSLRVGALYVYSDVAP